MIAQVKVEGYDAFLAEVEKHKPKTIYALFSGSKDANGKSWCPDCVTGELKKKMAGQNQSHFFWGGSHHCYSVTYFSMEVYI